jgi:hypothetical protein
MHFIYKRLSFVGEFLHHSKRNGLPRQAGDKHGEDSRKKA